MNTTFKISAIRFCATFALIASILCYTHRPKPTLFIIGDSTVKNGSGKGEAALWGWGDFMKDEFDTSRLHIENHARGGRSSRTFQTEGLWANVLNRMKPGDFVIMQFGHNDRSPVNDTLRARGTIKGVGKEEEEIDNLITKKHEIVHTFGWYMRNFVRDTKAKKCTPIICSMVAQNLWKDGKVIRVTDTYAAWARQIAEEEGAFYIDLNDLVAARYEQLGPEKVQHDLFLKDNTHTTEEGARINAKLVADAIKAQKKLSLRKFAK